MPTTRLVNYSLCTIQRRQGQQVIYSSIIILLKIPDIKVTTKYLTSYKTYNSHLILSSIIRIKQCTIYI